MSFITEEKKPTLSASEKKLSEEKEINALIKAHGFDQGNYTFDPNPNINRKDGSIISGTVKGKFIVDDKHADIIVLDREQFKSERIWRQICSLMGYKYHTVTDIDKFVICPNAVEVHISIPTPTEDI